MKNVTVLIAHLPGDAQSDAAEGFRDKQLSRIISLFESLCVCAKKTQICSGTKRGQLAPLPNAPQRLSSRRTKHGTALKPRNLFAHCVSFVAPLAACPPVCLAAWLPGWANKRLRQLLAIKARAIDISSSRLTFPRRSCLLPV